MNIQLNTLKKSSIMKQKQELLSTQGIYLTTKSNVGAGKTVLLFPGHGAQYPNMLKDLSRVYPCVQEVFATADEVYTELTGKKLTTQIFYENDTEKNMVETALKQAEVMQPAIYTANMAMFSLWQELKVTYDLCLGHSLGEIAALTAGGVISLRDGVKIAYYRATSLNEIPAAERGGMISLKINPEHTQLKELLNQISGYYSLSLHNSSEQVVLSATTNIIKEIAAKCEIKKITYHILPVSHAFHSELLRPAVAYYEEKLKSFTFNKAKLPIFSTISSQFYDAEFTATPRMATFLASQLVTPFSFYKIVNTLYHNFEFKNYLEIGPKDILTKLVKEILVEEEDLRCAASNLPVLGDLVSLERMKTYMMINELDQTQTQNNKSLDVQSKEHKVLIFPTAELSAEEQDVLIKLKELIHLESGYPKAMIQESATPLKLDLALNKNIYQIILNKIRAEFNLNEADLPNNEELSLSEIIRVIESKLEPKVVLTKNSNTTQAKVIEFKNIASKNSYNDLAQQIKEIIQLKTGYPIEMLEAELDLEADLGIDSVKQAEIFVQVREKFGYEPDPELKIKEFNTIDKIINYTMKRIGETSEIITLPEQIMKEADSLVDRNQLEQEIKQIIQLKTGYPIEMLEAELDLEADLGIDSVKQAEIFVQVREKFGYEPDPELKIKEFNTIDKILDYVCLRVVELETTSMNHPTAVDLEADLKSKILNYCTTEDTLRHLAITVERPYDTNQGKVYSFAKKNFILVADRLDGEITEILANLLVKKGANISILTLEPQKHTANSIKADFTTKEGIVSAFEKAKANLGKVHGLINLYPLRENFSYFEVDQETWEKEVSSSFELLFYGVKVIYEDLENAGADCACFAATNIGGIFGLEAGVSRNPVGALTAGFYKSLQKEIEQFNGKIVDFTELTDPTRIAEILIDEFSLIEELIEIGYNGARRKTICVLPQALDTKARMRQVKITSDDVIVVSGGGRGILFELAKGLAELFNPQIIVTGRTELPDLNEIWLQMSETELNEYSSTYLKEMKQKHPELSPLEIKYRFEKLKNARELYFNIQNAQKAGYRIEYRSCDVAKRDSVSQLYQQVKSEFGKITGILNGAGLGSFGKLPKKPEQHSMNVVKVKAYGFYNLYHEFKAEPLKFFMSIGSISGRFGMDGQVDYAAGADIIARMSFQLMRERPELPTCVIGWTAWDDVGMAANPEVEKVQKEGRGLTYISVQEGVQKFLNELVYGNDYPEVIIYGELGSNQPLGQGVFLDSSHRVITKLYNETGIFYDRINYPNLERVVEYQKGKSIRATKTLLPGEDLYLLDHLVEGRPTFPGVMHIEAYNEIGKLMNTLEGQDLILSQICEIDYQKFVKYFDNKPLMLKLNAELIKADESERVYQVEIHSDFCNEKGFVLEADRLHSCGKIIFTKERKSPPPVTINIKEALEKATPIDIEKFYRRAESYITFGNTFQYLNYAGYLNEKEMIGIVTVTDDRFDFSYIANPEMLLSPITIDSAARCTLVGRFHQNGQIVIPQHIKNVSLYRNFIKGEKLYTHYRIIEEKEDAILYDLQIFDEENFVILEMNELKLVPINRVAEDYLLF